MSTFTLRLPGPPTGTAAGATRVAVKDIVDMAGLPTTSGSAVLAERAQPAGLDAACLAGIRSAEAGGSAWIVGRTNLHELAFGITGVNPWFGTPVNPIDGGRVPGGSSSGSAVAVATGGADVAIGTDTGGSVRIPAACCGVVGLKTTYGRIPLGGVKALGPSLDTVGPMAADVAGTVRGMSLLEPGFSLAAPPAGRLGRLRLPAAGWVDAAIDRALESAGFEVIELDPSGWDQASQAFAVVLAAEAWSVHGDLWRSDGDRLSPDVGARLEAAASIGPEQLAAAQAAADRWRRGLDAMLARVDAIALPVLADQPPPLDQAARMSELRYTGPFNLAGVPALALPVPGTGSGRFPASLQLAGPHLSEEMLLATGALVEQAVSS